MKYPFLLASLMAAALPAHASISLSSPASTYYQSFDSLAATGATNAWSNDSTLQGWSLFNGAGAAVASYAAGTGSSNAGGVYSFGSTGSTDRALGSLGSGNFTGYIAVAFTNASGQAFDSFSLSYTGEQWRDGGAANPAAQTMQLQYGFGSSYAGVSSWSTPGASYNITSPVFGGPASVVNGNVAGAVVGLGGTVSTLWNSGDTLWIRWAEVDNTGADHALAIDNLNFSVTAVPEPSSLSLLMAGLGLAGFVARRRSR